MKISHCGVYCQRQGRGVQLSLLEDILPKLLVELEKYGTFFQVVLYKLKIMEP